MKTFDEALRTVVSLAQQSEITPELMKKLEAYQMDRALKHKDLSIEIQECEILAGMLNGIVDQELCSEVNRCECVVDLAVKVFTLGVQIGMEMEKQETL